MYPCFVFIPSGPPPGSPTSKVLSNGKCCRYSIASPGGSLAMAMPSHNVAGLMVDMLVIMVDGSQQTG